MNYDTKSTPQKVFFNDLRKSALKVPKILGGGYFFYEFEVTKEVELAQGASANNVATQSHIISEPSCFFMKLIRWNKFYWVLILAESNKLWSIFFIKMKFTPGLTNFKNLNNFRVTYFQLISLKSKTILDSHTDSHLITHAPLITDPPTMKFTNLSR